MEKVWVHLFGHRLGIAGLLFCLYFIILILRVALLHRQPDFTTYFYACKAYDRGLNPYDTATLSFVAGSEITRPFLYPPIALHVFKFFSLFPYDVAYQLFLFLKVACLGGLVFVWGKYFCENTTERAAMLIMAIFAFGRPLHRDINAGNIAVFEQCMLWIGIAGLVRARYVLFAVSMILAAVMKPMNLLILFPLAGVLGTRRWRVVVLIVALSIILHGVGVLVDPEMSVEFLRHARLPDERGSMNPSSYALSSDIISAATPVLNLQTGPAGLVLYGGFVLTILLVFLRVQGRLELQSGVMLSLIVCALIAPRFKDYSYILLIVPSLLIMTRGNFPVWFLAVSGVIVCTSVIPYQPLLAAVWFFGMYVYHSRTIGWGTSRLDGPGTGSLR
jgi:hypothetical protein